VRFFRLNRDTPEQQAAAAAEQEYARRSQAAVEAGGLPLRAQERLAARQQPGRAALWSSDLSVDEYLAARVVQLEPLGQVLGASIYHIAYNMLQMQSWQDGELTAYSQALYDARTRALGRMQQEAALLGAHGVVGVRLEQKAYEWGSHLLDFMAIGTAVRFSGIPPLDRPFLSDLSGQETLTLLHAGYVPAGMALGVCAYYVVTTWDDDRMMRGWRSWGGWSNQEMGHWTAGIYNARHGAMRAMSAGAQALRADGIVGSNVRLRTHEVRATRYNNYSGESESIEDHVFEFTAIGTAVAEIGRGHTPVQADLVLDLGK